MKSKILLMFCFVIFSNALLGQIENSQTKRIGSQFEYVDCSCAVKIDLTIHNGLYGEYGGQAISNSKETSKGAVTVANLNDTDGDDIIDNLDNSVVKSSSGRDEVDLMKLIIASNGALVPSCPDLELVLQGPIKLWKNKTKVTPQSNTITISSLPLTIWVEATQVSSSVRDIVIQAVVDNDVKDEIKATAIWVDFIKKYKIKTSSGIENSSALLLGINEPSLSNFIDNVIPNNLGDRYGLGEASLFNSFNYSGICPTMSYSGENSAYAGLILTEYEVLPTDLRNQPGLLGVKFDFARQVDADEELIYLSNYNWQNSPDIPDMAYKNGIEGSNDDGMGPNANADEDLTPSIYNKIYSIDGPGFWFDSYIDPQDLSGKKIAYWKRDLNFKEFARISFGIQPMGDGLVQGSRCSDYVSWTADYTLRRGALTGVNDPYNSCNQRYSQVNSIISHTEIVRIVGTSNPPINVNLMSISTNSIYQFKYDGTTKEWSLIKGNASGSTVLGPFPLNTSTNKWLLIDGSNLTIEISNSGFISNGDTFRFVVNNSPINNNLN